MCAIAALGRTPHENAEAVRPSAVSDRKSASVKKEERDADRFAKRVEAALTADGPNQGFWGVVVSDADTGEVLYSLNADRHFLPASDAKLFTTAFALAMLGPDHRISTTVATDGTVDPDGVLQGDLVLIGRGDANLSNRVFPYEKTGERAGPPEIALAELADQLVARGIKRIGGNVIADDSAFLLQRFPTGWEVDDMMWSYGAAVSAIAVNDNTFTLEIHPGDAAGDPATIVVQPACDYYIMENSVRTSARGVEENLTVAREPGSHLIRVTGTMPAGSAPRKLTLAVEEPAEYAARLFEQQLEARGVQIGGDSHARHAEDATSPAPPPEGQMVLAEHVSPSLADDLRLTNKASENLHAELLLLAAAHEKAGTTAREDALKFESGFFKTAGILDGDVMLADGSGLSRLDLVTPRAVVQLLRYAASQPWGDVYRSTLPVAAEDGTLADRMKNTSAASRVFAKTGTTEHVNALSGYATTERGAHLIFSILGNNNELRATATEKVIDKMTVAMVEEFGVVPRKSRGKSERGL